MLETAYVESGKETIVWLIVAGVLMLTFAYGFANDEPKWMLLGIIGFMAVNGWNRRS
jgi:hypothetical protein